MRSYYCIGLMSGTSLDGLDICYVRFLKTSHNQWKYKIIACKTYNYNPSMHAKLQRAITLKGLELVQLDEELGFFFFKKVKAFINEYGIDQIDLIASHGHTVFHQPDNKITLQIGSPYYMANKIGVPIIYDFRTADVQNGGQGAPLVPVGDFYLFNAFDYCLNLGGFSNITHLYKNSVKAYDICPCNVVINHYAQEIGLTYDKDGEIAKNGNVNTSLLNSLNQLDYYFQPPPKTLGMEWVIDKILPLIDSYDISTEDKITTFTEHVAQQISKHLNQKNTKTLITGGGVLNRTLLVKIKKLSSSEIIVPEMNLIQFKEALIFAFLGLLRLLNKVNCFKSVTGGKSNLCTGSIIQTKKFKV